MNTKGAIFLALAIAGLLIGAALIVRGGLESIAASIRDKPLPKMPDKVAVRELTIEQATLAHPGGQGANTPALNVTVENMRVTATPTSPQPDAEADDK